jgi:cobalt-zinc-cadmium resistance protein CzcA
VLSWIIDCSLRHRLAVVLGAIALAVLGGLSLRALDVDAFPDTTPVQVQINTVAPSLGPEEVERQITFPIEQVLAGLPKLQQLRSVSKFGLSQVVLTFADGTDIYFARQVVSERLVVVDLPPGMERPRLGPVATGLGEVFHYVVTGQGDDQTEARTIHDWIIRPQLRKVKGTAEINSWGGFEKQFQVRVDPARLIRHGLTFADVVEAIEKNNRNVGGGNVRRNSQMLLVQGVGRVGSIAEVQGMVITARKGVPIKIGDVAEVQIGHEIRRGAVTADGKGEVVLGLGFMLMGENSHQVTWALKQKLAEVKPTLPRNVHVETVYDRTELVSQVLGTVRKNLFEAGLLVVAVLFLFLGSLRAAAIVALAIPLSMLFAFSGMLRFGVAASLLSLGAIDFGMIVDSSVVLIENCTRHLAHPANAAKSRQQVIRQAAMEVRRPTLFGELIIMIVYLPILTLEGTEGKLFRPMALTVIFALIGSLIFSMTLMPVLASLLLPRTSSPLPPGETGRGPGPREPILMRLARGLYAPVLAFSMRHRFVVIALALAVLGAAAVMALSLGTEFVPTLSEGAIEISVVRLAGTGLDRSVEENTHLERAILKTFPDEVRHVWSRIGTAEIATDPMGIELTDLFISLQPRERWQKASTQDELTELIQKEVRPFLGTRFAFSQPIKERLDEMVSGVRADVAVKLFGDDLKILKDKAQLVERVLRGLDGSADVNTEQVTGQPLLQVKINQPEVARYGVPAKAVLDLVESVGGVRLGEVVDGAYRFPLVLRLTDKYRGQGASTDAKKAIEEMPVLTAKGERLPLGRLATVEIVENTPSTITREWGQRRVTVTANVRGRDLGGFVAEAQRQVAEQVQMPPGRYHLEWSGQWENLIRARKRLLIVVPLVGLLILGLLYVTYGNIVDTLRVCTGIPFAAVGGIFALWLRGMPFSISAAIGFIAMSGVAVLDDMILVSTIRQLREKGLGLDLAVHQAALIRLRPVLMTTLVASLGFVPMAFSTGVGAEVQRPLATVVIGGVISAMVMSLFVVRVLYVVFRSPGAGKQEKRMPAAAESWPAKDVPVLSGEGIQMES